MSFPGGEWKLEQGIVSSMIWHSILNTLRFDPETYQAFVRPSLTQATWTSMGRPGREHRLKDLKIGNRMLEGSFDISEGGVEFAGTLKAKVRMNAWLDVTIVQSRHRDALGTFGYRGRPLGFKMNTAKAGYHHMVRFSGTGFTAKAGIAGMYGTVEVYDVDASWQRHYPLYAGGAGLSLGIGLSVPAKSNLLPCYLVPRCYDWAGTEVNVHTAGLKVAIGYNTFKVAFKWKNGNGWVADWSGWGADIKAEIDLSTLAVGRLGGYTVDKPWI